MLINMFDTGIDSDNLGDQFIMDAVWDAVRPLFPGADYLRTPTHCRVTMAERARGCKAPLSIVGGTNILKSHMLVRSNWRITPWDYLAWRNVVLLGVGWPQYSGPADLPTRQSCQKIPVRKARHAIFAVTYYRPAPDQDRAVFELLQRHYDTVYFWPQQHQDTDYVREIGLSGFVPIPPDIRSFDRLLEDQDVDFVGARLHGGIRALQYNRRSLIIPVDNRAAEISVSTNLPVASRAEPAAIEHWILNPRPTVLTFPMKAIEEWKAQFLAFEPAMALASAER